MSERHITCSDCGTSLDGLFLDGQEPCPKCGSVRRTVNLFVSDVIQFQESSNVVIRPDTVAAKATVPDPKVVAIGTATETEEALPIKVKGGRKPKQRHLAWRLTPASYE